MKKGQSTTGIARSKQVYHTLRTLRSVYKNNRDFTSEIRACQQQGLYERNKNQSTTETLRWKYEPVHHRDFNYINRNNSIRTSLPQGLMSEIRHYRDFTLESRTSLYHMILCWKKDWPTTNIFAQTGTLFLEYKWWWLMRHSMFTGFILL